MQRFMPKHPTRKNSMEPQETTCSHLAAINETFMERAEPTPWWSLTYQKAKASVIKVFNCAKGIPLVLSQNAIATNPSDSLTFAVAVNGSGFRALKRKRW